jgi:hypothetical protein
MPKTKISEYSTTNSANTDIESINIDEGCAPSGINNAIRELMVHLKEFQTGSSGDPLTVAGTFVASGGATLSGTNTLSGSTVMTASAGTSASPSIHFSSDTNTGIFSPAADTIAFAEGGVEAMRINSSGNVGIGTTSPLSTLVVSNGSNENIEFVSGSVSVNGGYIQYINRTTAATRPDMNYYLSSGGGAHKFYTNDLERARIDSSGNLLLGTTSAKSRFVVNGGQVSIGSVGAGGNGIYLYINDTLSDNSYMSRASAGNGTTTWYIGNQTITTSSDRRLKANIRPTERNAVELLRQWEIVDHEWNDPTDKCENNKNSRGTWTGVIAQQVQQVTPWLVNKPLTDNDKDGTINPWVMDFGYAVPLLVKAIQEQQALITQLQADVAALKGTA